MRCMSLYILIGWFFYTDAPSSTAHSIEMLQRVKKKGVSKLQKRGGGGGGGSSKLYILADFDKK